MKGEVTKFVDSFFQKVQNKTNFRYIFFSYKYKYVFFCSIKFRSNRVD